MTSQPPPGRRLLLAAAAADATGRRLQPAAVLVEGHRIVAAATPQEIGTPCDAAVVELGDALILPALVNAHCHLDLSHLGPMPFGGDFTRWIEGIRAGRRTDPDGIADSVARGAALSRAGGTALAGDIAGAAGGRPSLAPLLAMGGAGLAGVSFLEVFGSGSREAAAAEALRDALAEAGAGCGPALPGVQPHAPYSAGPGLYAAAAALGVPMATHLAETTDEIEFTMTGRGPIAEFLSTLGLWNGSRKPFGLHPIDCLADVLAMRPVLAAHVNYCEPRHLETLARCGTSVVFCPRAHAYFGHRRHAWQSMRAAGVTVALGTDGLPCLDTPQRISVLDEMRLLHRRDGALPAVLLEMATVAGAKALGFATAPFTLRPGPSAGLIALPIDRESRAVPLRQALLRDDAPAWVVGPPEAVGPRP